MILGIMYCMMVIYYTLGIRFVLKESWEDSIFSGVIFPIWIYEVSKNMLIRWMK